MGRPNYLLKTLQFKRICPTQACTTPTTGFTHHISPCKPLPAFLLNKTSARLRDVALYTPMVGVMMWYTKHVVKYGGYEAGLADEVGNQRTTLADLSLTSIKRWRKSYGYAM